jgi:hypothetical protein
MHKQHTKCRMHGQAVFVCYSFRESHRPLRSMSSGAAREKTPGEHLLRSQLAPAGCYTRRTPVWIFFAAARTWRMLSVVPSLVVLGLAAVAALRLAQLRPSPAGLLSERITASKWLGIATAIQSAHFAEEWATGFHIRFPALFGLDPMPLSFFVAFNVAWIAIWITSMPFLRTAHTAAFFAAWFLAIAGVLNGIAHPLMATASAGYFPGLISSPFIGFAGLVLWHRLQDATSSEKR